jgi:hypothetical protein
MIRRPAPRGKAALHDSSGAANFILFRAGPNKTIRDTVNRILNEYAGQ